MKVKIISLLLCISMTLFCSENQSGTRQSSYAKASSFVKTPVDETTDKAKTLKEKKIYENRKVIIGSVISAITAGAGVYYYYFVKPLQKMINKNNSFSLDEILNGATSIDHLTEKLLNQTKKNLSKEQQEKLDALIQKEKKKLEDERIEREQDTANQIASWEEKMVEKIAKKNQEMEKNCYETRSKESVIIEVCFDSVNKLFNLMSQKSTSSEEALSKSLPLMINDTIISLKNNFDLSVLDRIYDETSEVTSKRIMSLLSTLSISNDKKNELFTSFKNISEDPVGSYIKFEKIIEELGIAIDLGNENVFLKRLRLSCVISMIFAEVKRELSKNII